ncbi:MAG: hypothetical protein HY763_17390 [Planctomycetes bacterium]|nr:hypothetical protein [Planctomycetota bacterium]
MAHSQFRNELTAKIREAVARARGSGSIPHPGTIGALREAFVRESIGPVLRADVKSTNGHVIDRSGGYSKQIDVLLYSGIILPVLFRDKPSLVPIESCLYAMEVKSKSTKAEMLDAIQSP